MYISKSSKKYIFGKYSFGLSDLTFFSLVIFSVFCFFADIVFDYTQQINSIVSVTTVIISVYLCYLYRNNTGLFLMMFFIAYTNYSVTVGVYLDPSLRPSGLYAQFSDIKTYGIAANCTLIFEIMLLIFSRQLIKNPQKITPNNHICKSNTLIAIFCLLLYAVIFMTSFKFGINGERGSSSALNEYRIVFFIIGSYYSDKKKIFKVLWTILVLITSILILTSGNRIDMISSAIFLCCFWYDDLITYKTVLLFIPIAILVFAGVGFMRTGFNLSGKSITEIFSRLFDDKLTYEGAIWCYIPTLASIELTYVTSIQEKLLLLAEHIKYTFTLGSAGYNPDLSSYSHKYYSHWYGFLSTSYFYFWFYYPGAILFALLVQGYNKMAQKIISANNTEIFKDVKFTLSYFFISNVGRWYCYGAMGLIRGMFVCFVFAVIFYLANSLLTKKITF